MSVSEERSWTAAVRERAVGALPPEKLLADKQPSYVASWIYVFGVLSLSSLAVIILSGTILALKGPGWWHFTGIGHFFNSIHLWSVELFFFVMVIHLWGKYWMAAWRGGRKAVWITGAITFLVAIPCALTGYVSQQNFDAQWISTQAKDAMNAAGIGSFFNLLNFGQMYSYHILLLPAAVVAIVIGHVLLVRKHGVVPPFKLPVDHLAGPPSTAPARTRKSRRHEPPRAPGRGRQLPRVEGRLSLVRHRQGGVHRVRRGARARRGADDPVLLARREAEHRSVLGTYRPGRFRHDRHDRARRLERHRRLRTSVQPRVRRAAHPVHPPAEVAGREPSGRHRAGLRAGAAALDHRPAGAPGGDRRLPVGLARSAGEVDDRLRERAGQGDAPRPTTRRSRFPPETTGRCRR